MCEVEIETRRVAEAFGITFEEIKSKSRRRYITDARHTAMWLLRNRGHTYEGIGLYFGNVDHTSAVYACKKINRMMDHDLGFRVKLAALRKAMTTEDKMQAYFDARRQYEDADRMRKEARVTMDRCEQDLIESMLRDGDVSKKRTDGVTVTVKGRLVCSCPKGLTDTIRDWLRKETGDDSDFVETTVSRATVLDYIRRQVEEGRDESDFPEFLSVNKLKEVSVYGWKKMRNQDD